MLDEFNFGDPSYNGPDELKKLFTTESDSFLNIALSCACCDPSQRNLHVNIFQSYSFKFSITNATKCLITLQSII